MEKTKKKIKSRSLLLEHNTLHDMAEGVLVTNHEGKIIFLNKSLEKILKVPRNISDIKEFQKILVQSMDKRKSNKNSLDQLRALFNQPPRKNCFVFYLKNEKVYECLSRPQRRNGESGEGVYFFHEIPKTEKVGLSAEGKNIYDPLTELYSRQYFSHRFGQEIIQARENKQTIGLLLCDLNKFKIVNEEIGQKAGDVILKTVAQKIQGSVRGLDLVFRWGSDEFMVILFNASREGALIVANRISREIRHIGELSHRILELNIGIALFPEHGETQEEMIRLVNRARHIAKKGGDKINIGDEEYHLDEKTVKVVFQPILNVFLESGKDEIIGYEALGRDPKGKFDILEFFKRYQAIGELNKLKCICFRSQLKIAKAAGLKMVFINVDFNVLRNLDVVSIPSGLEVVLEISEMEPLYDIDNILKIVHKWRKMGYQFAIDDFGAGFISLPFVAKAIPEYIKLDRSTILQAVSSKQFKKFLKDLVRVLGNYAARGIIAEGIENKRELQVVKDIGVHMVQGFLLGRPGEINKPALSG